MRKIIKPRCGGEWSEAKFITFVKNQLRGATWKWPPISQVLKEARISKGVYFCKGCNCNVPSTLVVNSKRVKNVFVDHVSPIVDPSTGFNGWDQFINNLYCEKTNLQLLCGQCHDIKTAAERKLAVERRKNTKNGSI